VAAIYQRMPAVLTPTATQSPAFVDACSRAGAPECAPAAGCHNHGSGEGAKEAAAAAAAAAARLSAANRCCDRPLEEVPSVPSWPTVLGEVVPPPRHNDHDRNNSGWTEIYLRFLRWRH
jgi:hypothetical protein